MKIELKITASFEAPGFKYNDIEQVACRLVDYITPTAIANDVSVPYENIKTNYEITIKRKER